jgi:hypothetical protein
MVVHLVLVSVRLAVVVAGLALAYLSYRGYRRKGSNSGSLLALSVAFILIVLGAVVEGILYEFMGYSLTLVHTVESAITAAGLAVVLFAIHATRE